MHKNKMIKDKTIKIAFIICLVGHCLFLGMPTFSLNIPAFKEKEEIIVQLEIEKAYLLPKIDVMSEKKKIKEMVEKKKSPEPKPELQAEKLTTEELKSEFPKESVKVIDPQDEATLRYQDMVKQKIEEVRRYPFWAKRQQIEGQVYLKFVILSNGTAQKIRILSSSGFKMLDDEAIATIKRAELFPPIPKKINSTQIQIEIAIIFKIE